MGALDLGATMDALAAALVAGDVVPVAHAQPVEAADTGEAIVGYPTSLKFGLTFGRGADAAVFPVWVVAGLVYEADTRAVLSTLVGAGSEAFKDAVEGDLDGVVSSVYVRTAAIERVLLLGGLQYAAVRFDCEVIS